MFNTLKQGIVKGAGQLSYLYVRSDTKLMPLPFQLPGNLRVFLLLIDGQIMMINLFQ